ncbi:MAG TPA: DUF4349 domain-containing protein [Nocardioidaceae bacterium]|nr:DUF4349 domain-containing protein [Nocardioidaceae bacterium]
MASTPARSRRTVTSVRLGAVLAALVLGGGLTACSGGGPEAMSSDSAAKADVSTSRGDGAADSAGAGDSAGGAEAAPERAPGTANRTTLTTRAVIKTGQVALTDTDLDATRDEVDRLLFGFGGSVENEETSHDDDGAISHSTLVLRIPVAKFGAAMEALEKLGTVQSSDTRSEDVTTEVIDVDERVETLQNSLDRLQAYQRKSDNIDDLIRFEDQITERESQLQSLTAQQSYLADQTAMSTITLHLSTPDTYVEPDSLDDAGFLSGLKAGWHALAGAVVVGLTVLGAVLPFAVTAALVAVPVWLLLRRRQAVPAQPPAEPDAS